jgi:hypothetical protein
MFSFFQKLRFSRKPEPVYKHLFLKIKEAPALMVMVALFLAVCATSAWGAIYMGGGGDTSTQKGLVAHWTFDDAGSGTAKDSTPYENHGTVNGAVATADRHGQSGKAYEFDGVDDYMKVSLSDPLKIKTLSFKMMFPEDGDLNHSYNYLFDLRTDNNIYLNLRPGGSFQKNGISNMYVNGEVITEQSELPRNEWVNFTVILSNTYQNSNNLWFFTRYSIDDRQLWTKVSSIRIYDRALSESEIKKLYESYDNKLQTADTSKGLVGHWAFSDVSSGTAKDSTPYENHGSVTSGMSSANDHKGTPDGAVEFDESGKITITNTEELNFKPDDSFSLGGWISVKEVFPRWHSSTEQWLNTTATFLGRGSTSGSVGIGIRGYWDDTGDPDIEPDLDYARFGIGSRANNTIIYYSPSIDFDKFYHIFFVYTPGMQYTYINGELVDSRDNSDGLDGSFDDSYWGVFTSNACPGGNGANVAGVADDLRIYNRALSEEEVKHIYESYNPSIQQGSLNKGQVGGWTFDDAGSGTAKDSTPYENHGTVNGAVATADRHDQPGKAYEFDGNDDGISVDNVSLADFQPNESFSINFWINKLSDSDRGIINNTPSTNAEGWRITARQGNFINFNIGSSGGDKYSVKTPSNAFSLNDWQHVVCTYNGSQDVSGMNIYINGEKQTLGVWDNDSGVSINYDDNIRIGSNYNQNSSWYFDGKIDDVRIYDRALSESEIKSLYESYN